MELVKNTLAVLLIVVLVTMFVAFISPPCGAAESRCTSCTTAQVPTREYYEEKQLQEFLSILPKKYEQNLHKERSSSKWWGDYKREFRRERYKKYYRDD